MRKLTEEKKRTLKSMGLHYCKYYENIVRYNKSFCGKCRHCTYSAE